MCYPCTNCGRCGKFNPNSPVYTAPPGIPCLKCGGSVNSVTGICDGCGFRAYAPAGQSMVGINGSHQIADAKEEMDSSISN